MPDVRFSGTSRLMVHLAFTVVVMLPLGAIVWEHHAEAQLEVLQAQDERVDELQLRAVSAMGEGPLRLCAELALHRDAALVVQQLRPYLPAATADHLQHVVTAWETDAPARRILDELDGVTHARVIQQHAIVRQAWTLAVLASAIAAVAGVLGAWLALRLGAAPAVVAPVPGSGPRPMSLGDSAATPTPVRASAVLPPPPPLPRRQHEVPTPVVFERLTGRVLLVEDNPINQRVTRQQLQELGLDVEVAGDAETGLERLSRETFSVVLMDLQLPGIDGLTATRRLRAAEAASGRQPVPVVAITANAAGSDRDACLLAGMDGYLAKPARLNDIARALSRYVQPSVIPVSPAVTAAVAAAGTGDGAASTSSHRPLTDPTAEPVMLHDPILWAKLRAETAQSDPRMLEELVTDLRQQGPGQIADLRARAAAQEWEPVRGGAHRLKGSAGMLGLPRLSAAAKVLETAAKAGDGVAVQVALAELGAAFDATFADPAVQALN